MVWTTGSRFSLNMAALATPGIRCRWYDPVQGNFNAVSDSPFANTGIRAFSPPGERVLVLDAA
jgi:Putative collagen-binding domain of a collagenase